MKRRGYIELRCFCGKRLGGWEIGEDDPSKVSTLPTDIKCRDCKEVVQFTLTNGVEQKRYIRDPVRPARVRSLHLQ